MTPSPISLSPELTMDARPNDPAKASDSFEPMLAALVASPAVPPPLPGDRAASPRDDEGSDGKSSDEVGGAEDPTHGPETDGPDEVEAPDSADGNEAKAKPEGPAREAGPDPSRHEGRPSSQNASAPQTEILAERLTLVRPLAAAAPPLSPSSPLVPAGLPQPALGTLPGIPSNAEGALPPRATLLLLRQGREIRLRLDPPRLGRMMVQLRHEEDGVIALVRVETELALEFFNSQRHVLKQALAELGIDLKDLQLTREEQDGLSDQPSQSPDRRNERRPSTPAASGGPTMDSDWIHGGLDVLA